VVTGIEISIGIIAITVAGDPVDTGQYITGMDETATGIIIMPTIIAAAMIMAAVGVAVIVAVIVAGIITTAAVEVTVVVTTVTTTALLATATVVQIPADEMTISTMTTTSVPGLPARGIIDLRNQPAKAILADRPITLPAATLDKQIMLAQKRAHVTEPDR
jgi:hypothetical protein